MSHSYSRPVARRFPVQAGLLLSVATAFFGGASAQDTTPVGPPAKETPLSMVNALHTAFGEHHARAVHTKGVMLEGTFEPAPEARTVTKEPIFSGGSLPVVARFSLFAGVPDLPDNADGASPAGFAVKIKAPDGDDFDIECNQHNGFITATFDEFASFLRALGASGPGVPHPTPVETYVGTHPGVKAFLESRTYPASYAEAVYFGINALKFTNAAGQSVYVRYRVVPHAKEHYLKPEERKAMSGTYLQDELAKRVAKEPVAFDLFVQIAGKGDKIEDPSIPWPDSRKLVKLGTFKLSHPPADPETAQRLLLFLPGQPHPGVEAADPMLIMRNTAYPISFGQRQ